jgi:hypothetical protein
MIHNYNVESLKMGTILKSYYKRSKQYKYYTHQQDKSKHKAGKCIYPYAEPML